MGQQQIIQRVPVVSNCLGHFVPIYCAAMNCFRGIILSVSVNGNVYAVVLEGWAGTKTDSRGQIKVLIEGYTNIILKSLWAKHV